MEKKTRTNTDFKVVEIDETQHWSDAIKSKVSKIFTVYLYDASVVTNCCEVTPSYELTPLYYSVEFPENSDEKENKEVQEAIDREFPNQSVEYMHCSFVEAQEHAPDASVKYRNKRIVGRTSQFYNDHFENTREYLCCNHVL